MSRVEALHEHRGSTSRWLELSVRSPAEHERSVLLADALVALGGRGVIERDGWYVSYFAEPADVDAFLLRARGTLHTESGLDRIRIEHAWQPHEAWEESWRRGLGVRRIADRIVVHPSWIEPDELAAGDVVVELDPGVAFGTAEHGTTRGCLRLLERCVRRGDRIADVGAGSGILAITSALLGASEVIAIEGDELACDAATGNVARNGVADRVRVVCEWATSGSMSAIGPVEGIVSNIEAGLLEPLFDGFALALVPGGWLVVSGILDDQWTAIEAGLERSGFSSVSVDRDGVWRSGLFRRSDGRRAGAE